MIEAWQGIGERKCNQHRSPPLSEVLVNPVIIRYRYDTGTILVVPDRYHTGTHGTSTKPVRAVPVLIGTHGTGTGTDAMGRTRRPDRHRVNRIDHEPRQATGQGRGVRDRGQLSRMETGAIRPPDQCRGNSSPPRTRRSARPPARLPRLRRSIPCSLVACPAVHSLYLHPSRFYHPTHHSLGVIGKGERVETLRPRNQGVTTSPGRPIVLHGSSFNSFLWKRPPGEAPIVLHGNGRAWLTDRTRRPAR